MMPEMTLMLYWERASIRPAKKAPSERERPRLWVSSAMPKQVPRVERKSSSRERVRMTASMKRLRPRCAASSTAPRMPPTFSTDSSMSRGAIWNCPDSRGTQSIMGATMMS